MDETANEPETTRPDAAESIEALVDRYERPLLAYATRMLGGDSVGAQDAVQETFLRLCREDRSKIASRIAAWLFTVCRSRVIDMQRTKRPTSIEHAATSVADPSPPASQAVVDAEDGDRLAELIDALTGRQQEVLRLRMQGGLSYREIAKTTGLTVTNVGFHLHAAVRSLRQSMAST